jgi:hypothetical protein
MIPSTRRCLAPQFKASRDHVCDERSNEEYQQHPGNALEGFDNSTIHFQRPPVGVQDYRRHVLAARIDVLFELPDADATRNPHDVDGKRDVSLPRVTEFLADDAPKNCRNRLMEETRCDERHKYCAKVAGKSLSRDHRHACRSRNAAGTYLQNSDELSPAVLGHDSYGGALGSSVRLNCHRVKDSPSLRQAQGGNGVAMVKAPAV